MSEHPGVTSHTPGESSSSPTSLALHHTTNEEEEAERAWQAYRKKSAGGLTRTGSVKNLITRFSGPDHAPGSPQSQSPSPVGTLPNAISKSCPSTPSRTRPADSPVPSISVTPPFSETRASQGEVQRAQAGAEGSPATAKTDHLKSGGGKSSAAQKTSGAEPGRRAAGRDSVADSGMGSVSGEARGK